MLLSVHICAEATQRRLSVTRRRHRHPKPALRSLCAAQRLTNCASLRLTAPSGAALVHRKPPQLTHCARFSYAYVTSQPLRQPHPPLYCSPIPARSACKLAHAPFISAHRCKNANHASPSRDSPRPNLPSTLTHSYNPPHTTNAFPTPHPQLTPLASRTHTTAATSRRSLRAPKNPQSALVGWCHRTDFKTLRD